MGRTSSRVLVKSTVELEPLYQVWQVTQQKREIPTVLPVATMWDIVVFMPLERRLFTVMTEKVKPEFLLVFESVEEFENAVLRTGGETGFFIRTGHPLAAGSHALLQVVLRGFKAPVYFEGRVVWRRVRSGGPKLPTGSFVGLSDHDRERLLSVSRHLRSEGKNQDLREYPRYPVFVSASCFTSHGKLVAKTRNLSRNGAYLVCAGLLPDRGAHFPVDFFFEGREGRETRLMVRAAWIKSGESSGLMGIQFKPGLLGRRRIERVIERFEPGPK
jgi:hypothetical protein